MEPQVLNLRRRVGAAILGFLVAVLCLFPRPAALGAETRSDEPDFWSDLPREELLDRLIQSMSDDELLGQVFMLGYIGVRPSEDVLHWIRGRNLGGVKIFSRNVSTLGGLADSIRSMQKAASENRLRIPLLVSTDQEGGWVRHIKGETSITPGNIALGATGLPQDALLTGYYIGMELRALGVNMNFAPTIDVYSNPSAAVIGPRAFSSDPLSTAMLALAYFQGLSRTGVIATAKHYPGHGQADKDSHGALPVVDLTLEELWSRELLPYRVLIGEGIPAIMSGHLAFPRILSDLTPSSRSPLLIEGVLREKMGFDGVLITDDMEMNGALSGGVDTAQASFEALMAGNDMVLVSHTPRVQEATWELLRTRLARDAKLRGRVEASVRRILRLKLQTFRDRGFPLFDDPAEVGGFHPSAEAREFFAQSALRSTTLVRNADIPLVLREGERILLAGQFQEFLEEGRRRYPQADTLWFPYSPFYWAREEDLERVPRVAAGYDTIVFCLANYNSLEVLQALRPLHRRLIVISALSPVYLRETPWVRTALAVYGTGQESFRAGFSVLAGDFVPEGHLPVDFLDGTPAAGALLDPASGNSRDGSPDSTRDNGQASR
jgi:beta-N-acetylhexosaminidase